MNDKQHGLIAENLLSSLPDVLKNDADMMALAAIIAETLSNRINEIEDVAIYSRIDNLPENLLDILAHDFKVDWWDGNYTIEEKRATLKKSWRVHKTLGTKSAVETAISAIYPDTVVSEWFEYGGAPYHFRLLVDATYESIDAEKHKRVIERVEFYKNLRSVLDGIEYFANGKSNIYVGVAFAGYEIIDSAVAQHY